MATARNSVLWRQGSAIPRRNSKFRRRRG